MRMAARIFKFSSRFYHQHTKSVVRGKVHDIASEYYTFILVVFLLIHPDTFTQNPDSTEHFFEVVLNHSVRSFKLGNGMYALLTGV